MSAPRFDRQTDWDAPRHARAARVCSAAGLPAPLHDHALLPWRFFALFHAADAVTGGLRRA